MHEHETLWAPLFLFHLGSMGFFSFLIHPRLLWLSIEDMDTVYKWVDLGIYLY